MNLDRALIKSQAKELMKGNVFKLFIIIFVVGLLTGGAGFATGFSGATDSVNDISSFDEQGDLENNIDEYDFDEFTEDGNIEDFSIDDFVDQYEAAPAAPKSRSIYSGIVSGISGFASILSLFLAPLAITLAGVFYSLIKGKNMDWAEEFNYVFTKTFDKNYWNKFLLHLLQGIITALWALLFIIPGLVYSYKVYFTKFIMAEKPELSWKEAIEISKKMTDGHKGELFVLDLSFIGWELLTILTFGILSIYVEPYIYTTKALYYENFKLRAFQLGTMSEADFLTESEKMNLAYADAQNQQGGFYQPPQENAYQAPPVQNYTYQKAENITDTITPEEPTPAPQPVEVEEPQPEAPQQTETPWEE